jgi:hypothetical protein
LHDAPFWNPKSSKTRDSWSPKIIDNENDDDDFELTQVAPPPPKRIKDKHGKRSSGVEPATEGQAVRAKLKAALERIRKKKDNALRNWQYAKSRNYNATHVPGTH